MSTRSTLRRHAVNRKSATSCAAFLLNCFYTNVEMVGMNLTGANGKPCPDKDIVDSILGECFALIY